MSRELKYNYPVTVKKGQKIYLWLDDVGDLRMVTKPFRREKVFNSEEEMTSYVMRNGTKERASNTSEK